MKLQNRVLISKREHINTLEISFFLFVFLHEVYYDILGGDSCQIYRRILGLVFIPSTQIYMYTWTTILSVSHKHNIQKSKLRTTKEENNRETIKFSLSRPAMPY